MDQPLITVIVPVYKAEPYFKQCIDSIRNQTYRNLEIILVDDGSPDRCGEMCDAFAMEDPRIRVIHKENGGQSSARNAALDIVTGEYVGFVDSDDWIEPNMYHFLYTQLKEHNAQISACGTQLNFLDGSISYFNPDYPADDQPRSFTKLEALKNLIQNTQLTSSLCDKLYHHSILTGLRMSVGNIYEDMELVPQCIEQADLVVYSPQPLYHYRQTDSSTTRGEFNPSRLREADVALNIANDYKTRYPSLYSDALAYYVSITMTIIHRSKGVASCAQRRKELIRDLTALLSSESFHVLNLKCKLKLYVLRISVPLFELMMTLIEWYRAHR